MFHDQARRFSWALAAALMLVPMGARADYHPLGYPGAVWGSVSQDFSGLEGLGSQGFVQQGVEWARLPADISFKTFAAYRWRLRVRNPDFFNAHGPAVIVQFSKAFIDAGVDLSRQRFPDLDRTVDQDELFAAWYKRVELAGPPRLLGVPVLGFPLTTWGRVSHDMSGIEGDGTMGWVAQGVDWLRFRGGTTLTTAAYYKWRLRSQERQFYNVHGPSINVELRGDPFQAGVEYDWRTYPGLDSREKALQLYLNWYYAWSLGR